MTVSAQSCSCAVNTQIGKHVFRTSVRYIGLLYSSSVQFMCCEQTFTQVSDVSDVLLRLTVLACRCRDGTLTIRVVR